MSFGDAAVLVVRLRALQYAQNHPACSSTQAQYLIGEEWAVWHQLWDGGWNVGASGELVQHGGRERRWLH